jgi:hypothetical protein
MRQPASAASDTSGTIMVSRGHVSKAPGFVYRRTVEAAKWALLLKRMRYASVPKPSAVVNPGLRTAIAAMTRLRPPPMSA